MSQSPFIAVNAREVLARHGLDNFEGLWGCRCGASSKRVLRRGGWNTVVRLELEDINGHLQTFYLKRQEDQLVRSRSHLFGESVYAREFRFIQRFAHMGIPSLETAFFAQRRAGGRHQAILLTRALDDYRSLDVWFERWPDLDWQGKQDLIMAAAALVRALHNAGKMHNSLYPKQIFLKLDGDGAGARLIDLEETRRAWFGERDRMRDLSSLHRRSQVASNTQQLRFFLAYLGRSRLDDEARQLLVRILNRRLTD